jgi:dephospho-CoA kinase
MIIGITGCPGSGKSALAAVLAVEGWILIDADEVGREVVETDPAVLEDIADAFGRDVLDVSGRLNRGLVASRAFSSPENTRQLNSIVHPILIRRLTSQVNELRAKNMNTVVDCALIFEWGIVGLFDTVVCVTADEALRKQRIVDRDGRSSVDIDNLFSAQLPEREKAERSDMVFDNNDDPDKIQEFGCMLAGLPRRPDNPEQT